VEKTRCWNLQYRTRKRGWQDVYYISWKLNRACWKYTTKSSGPHARKRTAKSTNHSAFSTWHRVKSNERRSLPWKGLIISYGNIINKYFGCSYQPLWQTKNGITDIHCIGGVVKHENSYIKLCIVLTAVIKPLPTHLVYKTLKNGTLPSNDWNPYKKSYNTSLTYKKWCYYILIFHSF